MQPTGDSSRAYAVTNLAVAGSRSKRARSLDALGRGAALSPLFLKLGRFKTEECSGRTADCNEPDSDILDSHCCKCR